MQVVPFDTLKAAKKLEKSGLPIQQAEALAEVHCETLAELAEGHLATKTDIAGVKSEIAQVKVDLETKLNQVKFDIIALKADFCLVHWMMGLTLSGVSAILFKLFLG